MKTFLLVMLTVNLALATSHQELQCLLLDNDGHIKVVSRAHPVPNQCLIRQDSKASNSSIPPPPPVGPLGVGDCNDKDKAISWALQHKRGDKNQILKVYWNKNARSNSVASRSMDLCLSFDSSVLSLVKCQNLSANLTLMFNNLMLTVKNHTVQGDIGTPFNVGYFFGNWLNHESSNCCSVVTVGKQFVNIRSMNTKGGATYVSEVPNSEKEMVHSQCYLNTTVAASGKSRRDAPVAVAVSSTPPPAPPTKSTSVAPPVATSTAPDFTCIQQIQMINSNLLYNLYWNAAEPSLSILSVPLLLTTLVFSILISLVNV